MLRDILNILKILKLAFIPQVKSFAEDLFKSDEELIAFEHSDGRSTAELKEITGIKKDKMTTLWKTWYSFGLGDMVPVKGGSRFVRSLSLENLGIKVPKN